MTHVSVIENRSNNPIQEHEANHHMDFSPPWYHQWRTKEADLCPIKTQNPHPQTRRDAKKLVDRNVI